MVIAALVEGNSINSIVRMTGVAKHTVLKLLEDVGCTVAAYHDAKIRSVSARRVQVDEAWAFCYAKQKNVPQEKQGQFGYGDVWTWAAIDADTKLIISYVVGTRGPEAAKTFMDDLAKRVANRIPVNERRLPRVRARRRERFRLRGRLLHVGKNLRRTTSG